MTAGRVFAEAILRMGRYVQAFPEFGPERSGEPVRAYVRVSDEPIEVRAPVERVDMAAVFEKGLIDSSNVFSMIKPGGILVVGSNKPLRSRTCDLNIYVVDAKGIVDMLGKPKSINLALIGALAAVSDLVPIEVLRDVVAGRFGEEDAEVVMIASKKVSKVECVV